MSLESLKTSAYYDDNRFNHLKVAVVKFLVINGTTSGNILLKKIYYLNASDLDIMTKYGIIDKKFRAMDDVYSISEWAKKLIISD